MEGGTRIGAVPAGDRGPGRRGGDPFYNPAMALNRDLSVLLVQEEARRKGRDLEVADALCGAGARSLRIASEVHAPLRVHANDAHEAALAALRKSAKENGVTDRIETHHGDIHAFLASRRFDIVDIDPYGSPAPFLDAGVRATRHDGLLCITATDTGALAGRWPRVCRRRYGVEHRLHGVPWRAEVGLRALAGACIRAAAGFERAATPVLSVSRGHWMRVVVRIQDGRGRADQALAQTGWAWDDVVPRSGRRDEAPETAAGPIWLGSLHDETVDGMARTAGQAERALADAGTQPLLEVLGSEVDAPRFWIDPPRLHDHFGPPPRNEALKRALLDAGARVAPTHMDPRGVRTDADAETLQSAWSSA